MATGNGKSAQGGVGGYMVNELCNEITNCKRNSGLTAFYSKRYFRYLSLPIRRCFING